MATIRPPKEFLKDYYNEAYMTGAMTVRDSQSLILVAQALILADIADELHKLNQTLTEIKRGLK